jgi:hypothetical protein
MFDLAILSGFGVVALTLPGFVLLVRREWERSGAGLFLLSPACVFYVAYLASFAIRPLLQITGILSYTVTAETADTLLLAQATSVLAWYGFVIGYRLMPSPTVPALLAHAGRVAIDMRLRASAAYGLSLGASLAFVAMLAPLGVFTLDFGHNRDAYLNAGRAPVSVESHRRHHASDGSGVLQLLPAAGAAIGGYRVGRLSDSKRARHQSFRVFRGIVRAASCHGVEAHA